MLPRKLKFRRRAAKFRNKLARLRVFFFGRRSFGEFNNRTVTRETVVKPLIISIRKSEDIIRVDARVD